MGTLPQLDLQPLLGERFNPPTPAYIAALERSLGSALPSDYRTFLQAYGVCTCREYTSFSVRGGARVDVNVFLGSDPDDSYDIVETWRGLQGRLPPQVVPIACDPFGNVVGLCLSPPVGRMVYWEHDTEQAKDVAPSFTAFVQLLRTEVG